MIKIYLRLWIIIKIWELHMVIFGMIPLKQQYTDLGISKLNISSSSTVWSTVSTVSLSTTATARVSSTASTNHLYDLNTILKHL